MSRILRVFGIMTLWALPCYSLAQEPRVTITSREIVERLTRLEEGQKALAQRLEEVNNSLNKRIDDLRAELDQRFEQVNQRFDDMNRRFDDVNRRFDDVNNRFNNVMTLLQIIISALVALVLAIAGAGFVMWRKILTVDAAVQTKIGLDQVVRDQVLHLEQEVGFVKGKLKELSETLGKG
jgi:ABC-type multidrug transport system fused ATPase/permease subunit